MSPLASLLNFGPNFGEAVIALEKLKALGVPLKEEARRPDQLPIRLAAEAKTEALIRMDDVTYHYHREIDDDMFRLGPINLEIHEGETTFIVGGNGSGKTTLLKLLCGLYIPEAGSISWRGQEITDENREIYRQFFSVVFSDFYLFDNLFGLESFSRDHKALAYLQRLHLDRKVTITNGEFSTVDLSHGQRKRLALLTAYLEDRPVYIFDEWAADQDPLFKSVFYRELLPELKAQGKTLLVITHDDTWYGMADRIVKLRDGQLADGDEKADA
jgi:putative ATP-binding cassette transporter